MYPAVTQVKPLQDYILALTFINGEQKLFDMKPYLDLGIFQELKDLAVFNAVKISFDTVEWPNSADIDPETLFEGSYLV
jgi:hypothetical protein